MIKSAAVLFDLFPWFDYWWRTKFSLKKKKNYKYNFSNLKSQGSEINLLNSNLNNQKNTTTVKH